MIKVTSLETMEEIVKANKNLEWDGWNVNLITKAKNAAMSKDGVLRKGTWYISKQLPLDRDGWSIPKDLISEKV